MKNRVAIVTGGTRGIGRAIAVDLKKAGCKVAASYRGNDESAQAFKKETGIHVYKFDVADFDQCQETVRLIEGDLGSVDILINNAGVFYAKPFLDVEEAELDRFFAINFKGSYFAAQAAVPEMKKRGGGVIVNFTSQAGRRGEPNVTLYCSTKAAVISITQSLALELAGDNIRVNAIAPGVIDTPMWDLVDSQFAFYENKPKGQKKREVGAAVPLGRMGDPQDVAGPCVFLATDDARYITAQTLNVDGGNWMS